MINNMTMLILSCDAFSDLWDGHVKMLEKNWPDRDMPTYIVTDAPTDKKYNNVKILSAGTECEWSDRLAFALEHVKTDYVFITLDDYFLIKKVESKGIFDLTDIMKVEGIDYLRLFKRPKRLTLSEIPGYGKIYRIDTSRSYGVNLYSGIWKKSFIEYCTKKPLNAWKFEVSLYKRAVEYGAKGAVSRRNEFVILDVVRKGKLLRKAARYFKKHPGIYEGDRPVNTRRYEFKLTVQQQLSRHLPTPVKNKLKAFLTKHGKEFYSNEAE